MNNWHANMTFIDTETGIEGQLKLNFLDHICSDPFEVLNSLKGDDSRTREPQVSQGRMSLCTTSCRFFAKTADAIKRLGKRLKIEVIHDDMMGI